MTTPTRRIDASELHDSTARLLRELRETGEEVVVTLEGEPVAVLRPFERDDEVHDFKQLDADEAEVWASIDALSREIAAHWKSELSAVEIVAQQRR